jgi:hypothetical protein
MRDRVPRSRFDRIAFGAALGVFFATFAARADSNDIHGRFEVADSGSFARSDSIDALLGLQNRDDLSGNLRLVWEPSRGRWSLALQYVATLQEGDSVPLSRAESALLPAPPATWFVLTDTFIDRGRTLGTQGIDRLSIAYTAPDFVLRLGRQALTWGSGFVFRPMDLFDPFSPGATDTEYKPGTDMLYTQWLFADGSDLQFIVVPRPTVRSGAPSANASSVALHFHTALFDHQTTILLARDHGDWVGGVGVNGALGDASWNVELVPTFLDGGPVRTSGLANISDAVTLFDRNATLFAEYFHNGFGVGGGTADTLLNLPPDLAARLERGQIFNTRRDYLAGGMTLEVTPLLTVTPILITGLDDASLFALVSATCSLDDNLALVAGVEIPVGPAHTEFGGAPLAPGSATMLAPPSQIYLQLRRYF